MEKTVGEKVSTASSYIVPSGGVGASLAVLVALFIKVNYPVYADSTEIITGALSVVFTSIINILAVYLNNKK